MTEDSGPAGPEMEALRRLLQKGVLAVKSSQFRLNLTARLSVGSAVRRFRMVVDPRAPKDTLRMWREVNLI